MPNSGFEATRTCRNSSPGEVNFLVCKADLALRVSIKLRRTFRLPVPADLVAIHKKATCDIASSICSILFPHCRASVLVPEAGEIRSAELKEMRPPAFSEASKSCVATFAGERWGVGVMQLGGRNRLIAIKEGLSK